MATDSGQQPRLGMNMLLWSTDVSGPEHDSTFELLREIGYAGVEIPIFDSEVEKYRRLGERLSALGLTALGVTARSGDTSPISADPEVRQRSVDSLRAAAEYAAKLDVTLVVEYLNRFEMYLVNCAADAAALVREVDHPNCRLMYDTFHAHIEETDIRAALHACADVLVHFHASENQRGTPGTGQVDWDT